MRRGNSRTDLKEEVGFRELEKKNTARGKEKEATLKREDNTKEGPRSNTNRKGNTRQGVLLVNKMKEGNTKRRAII
jgi:hypothetical protein